MQAYDAAFYADLVPMRQRSAEIILPIVFDLVRPSSLVDIGCGNGVWLAAAGALGAKTLLGVEGEWIKDKRFVADTATLVISNLEQPINIPDRYDLAICMEVAEHLSPARASSLVRDLCDLSDVVLFSAAVPTQGGRLHVNEQWQSYWADHFSEQSYLPYDLIRPKTWSNSEVAWWYSQNCLVYMKLEKASAMGCSPTCSVLDIAHPSMVQRKYGPRRILSELPPAVIRELRDLPSKITRRLGR